MKASTGLAKVQNDPRESPKINRREELSGKRVSFGMKMN